MRAVIRVPVEEFLRDTSKPNREYWDGVVSAKALPTKVHSMVQFALLIRLRGQVGQPFPKLTARISPTKYLVPDVCVRPSRCSCAVRFCRTMIGWALC